MKPVLLQASARQDLRDAASWYRERSREIADRFLREVAKTLELVENFPGTGARIPMVTCQARRLPVAGFPYHVVFEELQGRVEVLAIAHDRKRPGYWSA